MNDHTTLKAWTAGLLLSVLAVTLAAPAAEAGHGRWRRYKNWDGGGYSRVVVNRGCAPSRVVEVHRYSSAGPALAGFIGGLALGAVLSRSAEPDYVYEDPYCHERFASLDIYRAHLRHYHHPRVVRVIEVSSGDCVHTYGWDRDRWVDENDDDGGDWED
jgi:hypothetical protein